MVEKVRRQFILPAVVPVGVAIVAAILIVTIGEMLLALFDPDAGSELARVELWVALFLALGILGAGALAVTRPQGTLGPLDRDVVIGKRPFLAPDPPRIAADAHLRVGDLGTVADIVPGYTLHARSGPLATVVGLLPGGDDFGRRRQGLIYATGLFGASDELWIPVEAVLAVYPETQSAFLAVKGDETEHFGWSRAPEGFRRGPHASHLPSAH